MKLIFLVLLAVAHSKSTVGAGDGQTLADIPRDQRAAILAKMAHVDELCQAQTCRPAIAIDCQKCMRQCMMTRFPDAFHAMVDCMFGEHSEGCDASKACVLGCGQHTDMAEKDTCLLTCCTSWLQCESERCEHLPACARLDSVAPAHRRCVDEHCSQCPQEARDIGRLPIIGAEKTTAELTEDEMAVVDAKLVVTERVCPRRECAGYTGDCHNCMSRCMQKRFPQAGQALMHCIFHDHIDVCDSSWTCIEQCIDQHLADDRDTCLATCCDDARSCGQQRCERFPGCTQLDTVAGSDQICVEEECQSDCHPSPIVD